MRSIVDIFKDKLNIGKENKRYYLQLEKILHRAVEEDIHYIIEANIYIEQFIKSTYQVSRESQKDLIDLIDEYILDENLKSNLHAIRINSNKIRHDEEYVEKYDYNKCINYLEIIDTFTDYVTSNKVSRKYEVFSLVNRFNVEKKSIKNIIYTTSNNSLNIDSIEDPFLIDTKNEYNYFLSNYSTEKFCLYIRKSSLSVSKLCPPIFFVIHNILIRKDVIKKSPYLATKELNISDFTEIHKFEFLILYSMRYGHFNFNKNAVNTIKVRKDKLNYVKYAYENIMYYANVLNSITKDKIDLNYDVNFIEGDYNFSINNRELKFEFTENIPKEARIEMWYSKKIKYHITLQNKEHYLLLLKEFFGYDSFRPGQLEVIINMLGNETSNIPLAIFPTGYGKSLIFQYCALLQPQKTIVIVPTEILACDQIYNLNETGLNIGKIISSLEKNINEQNGNLIFYTIPEVFLNNKLNKRLATEDVNNNIYNIVLDECHNISLWAHQFDPTYFSLSKSIVNNFKNCNITMFTATASDLVIDDIRNQFSNKKISIIQPVPLNRGHINYEFKKLNKIDEIYDDIVNIFKENYGKNNTWNLKEYSSDKEYKTLIINNDVEILNGLYERLKSNEYTAPYVSLFDDTVHTYKSFRTGNKKILLSNDDFVVGINIPDLVNLICIGMPPSKEWLYQESGRVGRTYENSEVVIYMQNKTSKLFEMLMNQNINLEEILKMQNETKELSIDISNINYFNNYFQNKHQQLSNFDYAVEGIENHIYVLNDAKVGYVNLNFDVKKRNEYDFLFYMMILMDYVNTWLLISSNNPNLIRYQLYCRTSQEIKEMIDIVNKTISITTKNVKLKNEYINKNNNVKTLRELINNLMDWYFDTILSIKREKIANTYQLLSDDKINSKEVEIDLAKYFNTTIDEEFLDETKNLLNINEIDEVIEKIKEEYQEDANEVEIIEEVIEEKEKREIQQDEIINSQTDLEEVKAPIKKVIKTSTEKLLDVIAKIYDHEEINFEFYELYKKLNQTEIYNLKYKLQKLLESGYILGYEIVLALIELESSHGSLTRFKKLALNTNKDLTLLLLEKEKEFISRHNYKQANKIIYSIYKPTNIREWLKKYFG